jgi:hypothetical protein
MRLFPVAFLPQAPGGQGLAQEQSCEVGSGRDADTVMVIDWVVP